MLLSCSSSNREKSVDRAELSNIDYRVFQNTPAWQLAKAVQDEDTEEVDKIVSENPRIINYQDSKYGNTLLTNVFNRCVKKMD